MVTTDNAASLISSAAQREEPVPCRSATHFGDALVAPVGRRRPDCWVITQIELPRAGVGDLVRIADGELALFLNGPPPFATRRWAKEATGARQFATPLGHVRQARLRLRAGLRRVR
jgi:hypothetical protein